MTWITASTLWLLLLSDGSPAPAAAAQAIVLSLHRQDPERSPLANDTRPGMECRQDEGIDENGEDGEDEVAGEAMLTVSSLSPFALSTPGFRTILSLDSRSASPTRGTILRC